MGTYVTIVTSLLATTYLKYGLHCSDSGSSYLLCLSSRDGETSGLVLGDVSFLHVVSTKILLLLDKLRVEKSGRSASITSCAMRDIACSIEDTF